MKAGCAHTKTPTSPESPSTYNKRQGDAHASSFCSRWTKYRPWNLRRECLVVTSRLLRCHCGRGAAIAHSLLLCSTFEGSRRSRLEREAFHGSGGCTASRFHSFKSSRLRCHWVDKCVWFDLVLSLHIAPHRLLVQKKFKLHARLTLTRGYN